ncbi:hypothetical protein GCM10017691_01090 [Pseudonocardia petroleophila]|uniref:DUF7701 domain-containing protein n=1 Tax=Pseudonocardia petroleophila TaxID=37331 RepID=A0A7G7MLD2_9PSEU|nr:hypothetical protein [Pseudonocardia petroleophila]QNG53593.1 hypothetical protein H6H00_06450 [Pseudonocardia petroleophila]
MNYIDQLAYEIREQVPRKDLPDESSLPLFRIYAVLLLAKGGRVDARDVHNAWVAWSNDVNPGHASSVPFEELSRDVALEDMPYVRAIHEVAARVERNL